MVGKKGSWSFQPFAITLIGGLLASGTTTLILVPTLLAHSTRSTTGR